MRKEKVEFISKGRRATYCQLMNMVFDALELRWELPYTIFFVDEQGARAEFLLVNVGQTDLRRDLVFLRWPSRTELKKFTGFRSYRVILKSCDGFETVPQHVWEPEGLEAMVPQGSLVEPEPVH
jgi:hypothetical protein